MSRRHATVRRLGEALAVELSGAHRWEAESGVSRVEGSFDGRSAQLEVDADHGSVDARVGFRGTPEPPAWTLDETLAIEAEPEQAATARGIVERMPAGLRDALRSMLSRVRGTLRVGADFVAVRGEDVLEGVRKADLTRHRVLDLLRLAAGVATAVETLRAPATDPPAGEVDAPPLTEPWWARVHVSLACAGCEAELAVHGPRREAKCASCGRTHALEPLAWRRVLDGALGRAAVAEPDQPFRAEGPSGLVAEVTRVARSACGRCGEPLADSGFAGTSCGGCGQAYELVPAPAWFRRVAWPGSLVIREAGAPATDARWLLRMEPDPIALGVEQRAVREAVDPLPSLSRAWKAGRRRRDGDSPRLGLVTAVVAAVVAGVGIVLYTLLAT